MDISLIIPFYNEEEIIARSLILAYDYLSSNFKNFELIFVDDGSSDNSYEILEGFSNMDFILMKNIYNKGKGNAVKNGVNISTGRYVFYTDADLPYDLENIEYAMQLFFDTDADVITGIRSKNRNQNSSLRRIFSNSYSYLSSGILNIPVTDTQCGFKGFKKTAVKRLFDLCTIDDYGFDLELVYLANMLDMKILHLPVEAKEEIRKSKINAVSDSANLFFDIFKVAYNNRMGKYKNF